MARGNRIRLNRFGMVWTMIIAAVLVIGTGYQYLAPWPYRQTFFREASANHLSPFLVAAVARVESRFRPDVVSRRGAVGIMQLMPSTASWIRQQTKNSEPVPEDLSDPAVSIHLGTWYLEHLLTLFHGNLILCLAAYNSGPRTVQSWLKSGVLRPYGTDYRAIPYLETKNFVHRVLFFERIYRLMYGWQTIGQHFSWGVVSLAKVMSEDTKMKLGERLGVAGIVRQEGWGGVPARQCGNLVREAIRLAEEQLRQT